jgi:hypothetical protein
MQSFVDASIFIPYIKFLKTFANVLFKHLITKTKNVWENFTSMEIFSPYIYHFENNIPCTIPLYKVYSKGFCQKKNQFCNVTKLAIIHKNI